MAGSEPLVWVLTTSPERKLGPSYVIAENADDVPAAVEARQRGGVQVHIALMQFPGDWKTKMSALDADHRISPDLPEYMVRWGKEVRLKVLAWFHFNSDGAVIREAPFHALSLDQDRLLSRYREDLQSAASAIQSERIRTLTARLAEATAALDAARAGNDERRRDASVLSRGDAPVRPWIGQRPETLAVDDNCTIS